MEEENKDVIQARYEYDRETQLVHVKANIPIELAINEGGYKYKKERTPELSLFMCVSMRDFIDEMLQKNQIIKKNFPKQAFSKTREERLRKASFELDSLAGNFAFSLFETGLPEDVKQEMIDAREGKADS